MPNVLNPSLTGKDNVRRKFAESFFLAPQSNGYYVLNDAFRFIAEDEPQPPTSEAVNESQENVASSTGSKEPELVQVADKSLPSVIAAIEPVSNGNVDVCNKPVEQLTVKEPVVAEPPVELVKHIDDQLVVESSPDRQDGQKNTYASILKKESMRTTLVHAPSTTKKISKPQANGTTASVSNPQANGTTTSVSKPQANGTAPPAGQQLKEAANSTSVPDSSVPNGNTRHGNDVVKTEDKGYSVYIGNLPYDATVQQVGEEFKKFGPIKPNGIQVRCSKGFCFGFVEFESLSSVQKAIELSCIEIAGYTVFVEEKKTSTRVVNGVPTFSGGRGGGYRNDGYRGRGNFSGGRGYGRNSDYVGRRGDYNGNGGARSGDYQKGYQNGNGGGGRTVRQGGTK